MKTINKVNKPLKGELTIPGDKSISHRSIMFGSISKGETRIKGFLKAADCLSTMSCFKKLGVNFDETDDEIIVHGMGLHSLKAPSEMLYTGNSGTTTRLISGILSGQPFTTKLTGDASIEKRPMKRIIDPLTMMGADIKSVNNNNCAPLLINPSSLHGIAYNSPVASAQVKSSILLAGLYADGITSVTEPALSRNHTELMLGAFGAKITSEGLTASIEPADELYGMDITVPGDISSAAYFMVAGLITKGSEILIKNVGINPTRDGIIKVIKAMNGNIELLNKRNVAGEDIADVLVRYSDLKATTIEGDIIPTLIDEIPVICMLAAVADGTTIIKDAAELHVKESDRIAVMEENLNAIGVNATGTDDGLIIEGNADIVGGNIKSYDDHRIAMSFVIAGLVSKNPIVIDNEKCVDISYPAFFNNLEILK